MVSLRQLLDARGMVCSSFGVSFSDALNQTDEVAANARALGAKFVRVASLPNRQPFTLDLAKQSAAELNRIGKQLRVRIETCCNQGRNTVRKHTEHLVDLPRG